jgi:hypothetical protein
VVWDQLRARLVGVDDVPMLLTFDISPDSIRTLPAMQHDEHKPEDVNTDGEDHAPDEARYRCMSRPGLRHHRKRPSLSSRRPRRSMTSRSLPKAIGGDGA